MTYKNYQTLETAGIQKNSQYMQKVTIEHV